MYKCKIHNRKRYRQTSKLTYHKDCSAYVLAFDRFVVLL